MAHRLARTAKALTEHVDAIARLRAAEPSAEGRSDEEVISFLMASDMSHAKAAEKMRDATQRLAKYGNVTIEDCAPFMRSPSPGRRLPDGACFLLEDGKGGVARDKHGRPVVVVVGMQHGSAEEMQRQFIYYAQRLKEHTLPGMPPGAACVVVDVQPAEKGAPPTIRFPDREVRTLFELQERCYPGALCSSTHFCGLPRLVVMAFRLVRPFMAREAYEAMVLKPSFSHLSQHIPPESMLPRWGGTFQFEIDEYVEWRAREEGVPPSKLCPRGAGRKFDTAKAAAAAAAAVAEASGGGGGGLSVVDLLAEGGVMRKGRVSKRGGGRGLFASVRWKTKLLVLAPTGLCYFDKVDEADETNRLARLIVIDSTATVRRVPEAEVDARGPAHQFVLHAHAREYLFGVDDATEASEWVAVIERAVHNPPQAEAPMATAPPAVAPAADCIEVHAVRVKEASGEKGVVQGAAMRLTPSQVEVEVVAVSK